VCKRSSFIRIEFTEFAWCVSDGIGFGVEGIVAGGGEGVRLASSCKVIGGIVGSFSSTIAGLNGMRPVSLNPERIVECLNVGEWIDWIGEKNSLLLNSEHPVRGAVSSASVWKYLYGRKITISNGWKRWVECDGRQKRTIFFLSEKVMNSRVQ